MSDAWFNGFLAAFAIALLNGSRRVFSAQHPEQKVRAFSQTLAIGAAAALAAGITLLVSPRLPLPGHELGPVGSAAAVWLSALREEVHSQRLTLACVLMALGFVVGAAAAFLRSLHGFVLEQRLDLATREQIDIASAGATPTRTR